MTKALVKTQIRLRQLVGNREAGQGTLEYIGMIVVAGILIVGVVSAAQGANLGPKFMKAISDITGA